LEKFVQREMGQPFTLIFVVGQVEEIRREGTHNDGSIIRQQPEGTHRTRAND
jgi:hypothetical protein